MLSKPKQVLKMPYGEIHILYQGPFQHGGDSYEGHVHTVDDPEGQIIRVSQCDYQEAHKYLRQFYRQWESTYWPAVFEKMSQPGVLAN